MDDPIDIERRKGPIDRRSRRFDRKALATKLLRNTPANFEAWPGWREPWTDSSRETARRFLLHREHAEAIKSPVSRHDRRIAPSVHCVDGFAIRGDKPCSIGVGQHRGVRRDVGGAPWPQDQPLGLDHRATDLRQRRAWFDGNDHWLGIPCLDALDKHACRGERKRPASSSGPIPGLPPCARDDILRVASAPPMTTTKSIPAFPMLRTPFIETLSDLFIRSAQW